MPNFRGINVLQYECDRLAACAEEQEEEISLLHELKDLYSESVFQSLVETHTVLAAHYRSELEKFQKAADEFINKHDSSEADISYEPLEFIYQIFCSRNLPYLLKQIEITFSNRKDSLLSNGVVHFSIVAKKVALHELYCFLVDSIVSELLLNEEIKELRELPRQLQNGPSAIQAKYEYFKDRLQHCLEIGNKLRELSK